MIALGYIAAPERAVVEFGRRTEFHLKAGELAQSVPATDDNTFLVGQVGEGQV
jgi:hypothetical protein